MILHGLSQTDLIPYPMQLKLLFAFLSALVVAVIADSARAASYNYSPSGLTPPPVQREFRGAWVATVNNIDWPSQPGLSVSQQKRELIAIMDRAAELHLNAIVFQVRPACDAFYDSRIEPWSPFLTGTMGKAPSPFYDPLALAIEEAHKRGIELHAWFNPFRASHPASKSGFSADHISRTHPGLVRQYGQYLWLDPGEPEAQEYSLRVIMDVVRRYDIDAVQFDDYFYPYKDHDVPFPDESSWRKYGVTSHLGREDWRRENVNAFVTKVGQSIKSAKPWVKFGVSPFGIWQSGHPPQIKGSSAYDMLYCDARMWLANGWLDYCAPQLYWQIESPAQSFPVLLKWWEQQNTHLRHVWAGVNSIKVGDGWKAEEIVNQIRIARELSANAGVIHYSMKALMQNRGGLATALARDVYREPALAPAFPWLESQRPVQVKLEAPRSGKIRWEAFGSETHGQTYTTAASVAAKPASVNLWVLQAQSAGKWTTSIISGSAREAKLPVSWPDAVALTPIDRCGVSGDAVVLQRQESR